MKMERGAIQFTKYCLKRLYEEFGDDAFTMQMVNESLNDLTTSAQKNRTAFARVGKVNISQKVITDMVMAFWLDEVDQGVYIVNEVGTSIVENSSWFSCVGVCTGCRDCTDAQRGCRSGVCYGGGKK